MLNAVLKELAAVKMPSGIKALGMVRWPAIPVLFPLTDIEVDIRTRTHGLFQLLLKHGSDNYCLADTREYWTPSHLRGYHRRSLHV